MTNSPEACARLLNRPGFDVILIGGRIARGAAGSLGATALLQIQQIRADLCFLGACAFDPDEGVAAFDAEDAELKRAMVKASGQIAIALTSEKLMTAAPFAVAPAIGGRLSVRRSRRAGRAAREPRSGLRQRDGGALMTTLATTQS